MYAPKEISNSTVQPHCLVGKVMGTAQNAKVKHHTQQKSPLRNSLSAST